MPKDAFAISFGITDKIFLSYLIKSQNYTTFLFLSLFPMIKKNLAPEWNKSRMSFSLESKKEHLFIAFNIHLDKYSMSAIAFFGFYFFFSSWSWMWRTWVLMNERAVNLAVLTDDRHCSLNVLCINLSNEQAEKSLCIQ